MSTVDDQQGYASASELTAGALDEEDYTMPGGARVRIRGMSRHEVLYARRLMGDGGLLAVEQYMIRCALVAPRLSEADVRSWYRRAPAGSFDGLSDRIRELSGMTERPDREAYDNFRDEPGGGVRALPSAEDGTDGDGAQADDGSA